MVSTSSAHSAAHWGIADVAIQRKLGLCARRFAWHSPRDRFRSCSIGKDIGRHSRYFGRATLYPSHVSNMFTAKWVLACSQHPAF
jgi:hypothetical protein